MLVYGIYCCQEYTHLTLFVVRIYVSAADITLANLKLNLCVHRLCSLAFTTGALTCYVCNLDIPAMATDTAAAPRSEICHVHDLYIRTCAPVAPAAHYPIAAYVLRQLRRVYTAPPLSHVSIQGARMLLMCRTQDMK